MLKQRIVTALILTPLVVWAIIALPGVWFNVMLLLFVVIASWEWALLAGLKKTEWRMVFAGTIGVCWIFSTYYIEPSQTQLLVTLWIMVTWWVIRAVRIIRYTGNQTVQNYFHPGRALTAMLVIAAPFFLVQLLRTNYQMPGYLLYVLMTIWAADTFAYFVGKKWGKQKLAPNVSPGKSWQGVYGAILSGVFASVIGAIIFNFDFKNTLMLLVLTQIVILFSIIGDLSESLYKRELNIKDSGQILPGHGGVLDRIDSLTAAIPVFMLGMHYMGLLA